MDSKVKKIKFGSHLVYDAYGCKYESLNNMELCYDILIECAKLAKMKTITEPYIVKANENTTLGGKDPGGFSGFVMIQESHISIHTFPNRRFVTMDIYSCTDFDEKKVLEYLEKMFLPEDKEIGITNRALKYPSENIV